MKKMWPLFPRQKTSSLGRERRRRGRSKGKGNDGPLQKQFPGGRVRASLTERTNVTASGQWVMGLGALSSRGTGCHGASARSANVRRCSSAQRAAATVDRRRRVRRRARADWRVARFGAGRKGRALAAWLRGLHAWGGNGCSVQPHSCSQQQCSTALFAASCGRCLAGFLLCYCPHSARSTQTGRQSPPNYANGQLAAANGSKRRRLSATFAATAAGAANGLCA